MANAGTIVWITGATQGIGQALAQAVPYPDARVVNISRRRHPQLETVVAVPRIGVGHGEPTEWRPPIGGKRHRGDPADFLTHVARSRGGLRCRGQPNIGPGI